MNDAARRKKTVARRPGSRASGPFDRGRQYNAKRDFIISEAATIFKERGFARTSLEDISTRLNITKTALYYYFKSKEEILFECTASAWSYADAIIDQAEKEGRSGRDKLEQTIRTFLTNGLKSELQIIAMRERHTLSGELRARLEKRRRARQKKLRAIVMEGIADRSIRPCDPAVAISVWTGTVTWLLENYVPDKKLTPDELADQVVTIFMHGLAAPGKA